jgi:multisubunit Na+/H+ antiporter MnhE subunit
VSRVLAVILLTATYLLVLGSLEPWDVAAGLLLAVVLTVALRGRPGAPAGPGGPLLPRLAALPRLVGSVLVEVAAGTWDVGLRVLHLRPLDAPGIVLVPIGDRSPLGVAVNGLLVGLSPGSVLLEVDRKRRLMLFHVIDASDPDRVRARIERSYQRYQRRVWP